MRSMETILRLLNIAFFLGWRYAVGVILSRDDGQQQLRTAPSQLHDHEDTAVNCAASVLRILCFVSSHPLLSTKCPSCVSYL